MSVLVDTNVFLRVVEVGHPQHAAATGSLRILRRDSHELCIVPQVHYEFWVAATRPIPQNGLGMTAREAESELQKLGPPLFRFLLDERAIYQQWQEIVETHQVEGKKAHDARLVAAMRRHQIPRLLTFNVTDFQRYRDLELFNPDDLVANR